MKLQILPQLFTICKPEKLAEIDWSQPFLFLAQTDEETSLVCPQSTAPQSTAREDGWRGMRITGTLDFSLVGVLAPIAALLAQSSIGVFVVSTYNTDYFFVKQADLHTAQAALMPAGYTFTG